MYQDNLIWIGNNEAGQHINILPKMANRHGLVAGATGTGKTVTLKVLAESFSDMGVPVFLADVKGDIAGLMAAGEDSEDMQARIEKFGLSGAGFSYHGYPVTLWDIYGQNGIQLRTTISEMGPLLLSRVLDLNDLQSDLLTIIFKIADDNDLLLIDTKDLKAMLGHVRDHAGDFTAEYGKISTASVDVILRAVVALEADGGETFFGEPALDINDWIGSSVDGKGMLHVLDSSSLINNGRLYSTFLLWLLSELFETLPEVGDPEKPNLVFFFDEAHLLFSGASKALLEKIEQVVKLVRSKGVGVYFCTQNPADIPGGVLAQLGNKIQHGLHAYTPAEQKGIKAAADSFRANPDFDTEDTLSNLGTGEALVSVLQEDGSPAMVEKAFILPPQSRMGVATAEERSASIQGSPLNAKYAQAVDPDSAYEFLMRQGQEAEAQAVQAQADAQAAKEQEKADKEEAKAQEKAEKEAAKAAEKEAKKKKQAVASVGSTVAGTVGREVGKQLGKNFGKFGKTLGGNTGAAIARGIIGTLLKK